MKDRSMRRPCYGFYMGYVEPYSGYAAFVVGFPKPLTPDPELNFCRY